MYAGDRYLNRIVQSSSHLGRTQPVTARPQVSVPLISRPVVQLAEGRDHPPGRSPVGESIDDLVFGCCRTYKIFCGYSFTVVILNAALAVLSDKGLCVCVCVRCRGLQLDILPSLICYMAEEHHPMGWLLFQGSRCVCVCGGGGGGGYSGACVYCPSPSVYFFFCSSSLKLAIMWSSTYCFFTVQQLMLACYCC